MPKLPKKFTNRLRREPDELLEVTRHYYQQQLDRAVLVAFPVWQRRSLEKTLAIVAVVGAIAAAICYVTTLATGIPSVGLLIGVIIAVIGRVCASHKSSKGIVAVTDTEFILIKLENSSFDSGEVAEKLKLSTPLPKPKSYKGGMLGDALPFTKEGDVGWYYFALTDHGTGYISILNDLREFSIRTSTQIQSPELVETKR